MLKARHYVTSAALTLTKLVSALLVGKIFALNGTKEEFGVYNQLFSVMALLTALVSFGSQNAMAALLKRNGDDHRILKVSLVLVSLLCCLISLSFLLFNVPISNVLFPNIDDSSSLLYLLSFSLFLYAYSALFTGLASAYGDTKKILFANLSTPLIGGIVLFVTALNNIKHANYVYIFMPGLPALYFICHYRNNIIKAVNSKTERFLFKSHLKYSAMGVLGLVSVPLYQVHLRSVLGETNNWDLIGNWGVMTRFTDLLLIFINILFSVFLVPSIAQSTSNKLQGFLRSVFKLCIFSFSSLLLIYLFREWLVTLVFDGKFLPAVNESGFIYQLLGDFFKILAFSIAYYILIEGRLVFNVILQFTQLAIYIFLISSFGHHDLNGLGMANFLTYAAYTVIVILSFLLLIRTSVKKEASHDSSK
ncbi:oligosaccharide flippase family protein [Aeromonas sp. QDB14]|uniref:oligosaccharide flippase family protein n=1 Tax=Aeromonas sp. QDB14 TaxID=2989836 RepID=UPI0022E857B7|nr:oligosaccharide flippase family protein [Aeromonas sp. QDB14]